MHIGIQRFAPDLPEGSKHISGSRRTPDSLFSPFQPRPSGRFPCSSDRTATAHPHRPPTHPRSSHRFSSEPRSPALNSRNGPYPQLLPSAGKPHKASAPATPRSAGTAAAWYPKSSSFQSSKIPIPRHYNIYSILYFRKFARGRRWFSCFLLKIL